jgi:hypothetical protein
MLYTQRKNDTNRKDVIIFSLYGPSMQEKHLKEGRNPSGDGIITLGKLNFVRIFGTVFSFDETFNR